MSQTSPNRRDPQLTFRAWRMLLTLSCDYQHGAFRPRHYPSSTPSITLTGAVVGTTELSRTAARAKSAANSSRVCSRPPVITIMLRSSGISATALQNLQETARPLLDCGGEPLVIFRLQGVECLI